MLRARTKNVANERNELKITAAAIISVIYALVMVAVVTGVAINIVEDGWLAPTSLFLLTVVAQIVVSSLLHPTELMCLPCGVAYYITLPSMYLILIMYALCNLNDVTWGTRDFQAGKTSAVTTLTHTLLIYFQTRHCCYSYYTGLQIILRIKCILFGLYNLSRYTISMLEFD